MLAALDLALRPGELVALVGPNGAGKTTLIRALAGLSDGPGTVARAGTLAYLPAERTIGWPMRADAVVALGLARPHAAAVARAMARTDTARFAARPATTLSTGERARLLLARAIVAAPAWLLLDEPTANLDPFHAAAILTLLHAEAARGAGVLFATHDLTAARAHASRVLLLDNGRLVGDGRPAQVLDAAALATVFGVREGAGGWHCLPLPDDPPPA